MHFGNTIIRLSDTSSTNNYVASLAKAGKLVSGTVIMAENQTEGRGQMHRSWDSERGKNLTFSLFLENVSLSVTNQFILSKIMNLGVIKYLSSVGLEGKIKWPNDILVNGQKICGMLIENQVMGSTIQQSIVGIGLNINQISFRGFAATSMKNELGKELDLNKVLDSLLFYLNQAYDYYRAVPDPLTSDYLDVLSGYRTEMSYEDDQGQFRGIILGIAESGHLRVERRGEICEYSMGEIRWLG